MLQLLAAPLTATFLFTATPVHGVALEASAPVLSTVMAMPVAALIQKPERRLGEARTVTVQFCRRIEDWSPFLTRFDPEVYTCIEIWADEQPLWIEEQYDTPVARFYARKGTLTEATLMAAKTYDRLRLEVAVREMQAGRTWIEVTSAQWTDQQTPEGTLLHTIRALDMIEREGWAFALSELERALRPDLPGHVRAEIEAIKSRCDRELNKQLFKTQD